MTLSLVEIEKEASQLTLDEKTRLISYLIATLEPAEEDDIEAAWEKEVLARSKEIQEGSVAGVTSDETLARVRCSLRRTNSRSILLLRPSLQQQLLRSTTTWSWRGLP